MAICLLIPVPRGFCLLHSRLARKTGSGFSSSLLVHLLFSLHAPSSHNDLEVDNLHGLWHQASGGGRATDGCCRDPKEVYLVVRQLYGHCLWPVEGRYTGVNKEHGHYGHCPWGVGRLAGLAIPSCIRSLDSIIRGTCPVNSSSILKIRTRAPDFFRMWHLCFISANT